MANNEQNRLCVSSSCIGLLLWVRNGRAAWEWYVRPKTTARTTETEGFLFVAISKKIVISIGYQPILCNLLFLLLARLIEYSSSNEYVDREGIRCSSCVLWTCYIHKCIENEKGAVAGALRLVRSLWCHSIFVCTPCRTRKAVTGAMLLIRHG